MWDRKGGNTRLKRRRLATTRGRRFSTFYDVGVLFSVTVELSTPPQDVRELKRRAPVRNAATAPTTERPPPWGILLIRHPLAFASPHHLWLSHSRRSAPRSPLPPNYSTSSIASKRKKATLLVEIAVSTRVTHLGKRWVIKLLCRWISFLFMLQRARICRKYVRLRRVDCTRCKIWSYNSPLTKLLQAI